MAKQMLVFANPYAHIDHLGRLACAFPVAEAPRSTAAMPVGAFVGAKRQVVSVDKMSNHKDDNGHPYPRGKGYPQLSRTNFQWLFQSEPVSVPADGPLSGHYLSGLATGDILAVDKSGSVPLGALAAAREAAIASWTREHDGELPDLEAWALQFPLDLDVAAACEVIAEARKTKEAAATVTATNAAAAVAKAATEAKAQADAAAKEAAAAHGTRKAAARKALNLPEDTKKPSGRSEES